MMYEGLVMIDQIIIMKNSGIPMFSWKLGGSDDTESQISGFLTAINMFAKQQKGEEIKDITMDKTTLIFKRFEDNIIVIATEDSKYEQIIRMIMKDIIQRFEFLYKEKSAEFSGNISDFRNFKDEIQKILEKYLYFDYLKIQEIFPHKQNLSCFILLDRVQGETVYLLAKEYLDRKLIEFQSSILVKAFERIGHEILDETPINIIINTKKNRTIYLKFTSEIISIQEISSLFLMDDIFIPLKTNQIKNHLRKPGKLLFDVENPLVIADADGKGIISNNKDQRLTKQSIVADLNTILRAGKMITEEIYKDLLSNIVLMTDTHIYSCFYLNSNEILFSDKLDNLSDITCQFDQILYSLTNKEMSFPILHPFFQKIKNFLEIFH